MIFILVMLGTVFAVGALVMVLLRDGHPENGCGHGDHPKQSESERFYSQADRPAGPDAEDASLERTPSPPGRGTSRTGRLSHLGRRGR